MEYFEYVDYKNDNIHKQLLPDSGLSQPNCKHVQYRRLWAFTAQKSELDTSTTPS